MGSLSICVRSRPENTTRMPIEPFCCKSCTTSETPIPDPDSPVAHLLRAQSRWERSGITSYTYRAARQCFCPQEYVAQVEVQVVNRQVTDTTFVDPDHTGDVPDPQRFGTISNLFSFVQDAIEQDSHSINAVYHPELGYPTEVFVDYDRRMADEEQGFTVSALTPN